MSRGLQSHPSPDDRSESTRDRLRQFGHGREQALKELTPRWIYSQLERHVIGQEEAKKAVSVAAYNHARRIEARRENRCSLLKKSNILLIGPTGCGKTRIARVLSDILEVPFCIADATEYTEAGYYGKDVEVMISNLLLSTDHDVPATERGIIFVDEVDKIARRSHGARTGAGARDIGGEGVQHALLKLLEGREVFVPTNVTQHWNNDDFVKIDTTDILFICAGTFSDLHLYGEGRRIGFAEQGSISGARRHFSTRDLLDYGMMAEFLGRLPVTAQLEELDEEQLLRVLKEPPDSVLKEYDELLEMDRIELTWEDGALEELAAEAVRRRTGARGLRSMVDRALQNVMFEAPEKRGKRISITRETLRNLGERSHNPSTDATR